MKKLIHTLLTLTACLLVSCSGNGEKRIDNSVQSIPALKARTAGLASEEFATVQKRYAGYVSILKTKPDDVKTLLGLANLFMHEARVTGDHPYYYPAAEREIEIALQADPKSAEALLLKGSVLLSLHHFKEAKDIALKAKEYYPGISAVYGILVDANVELGDYDDAVKASDKMVAIRPGLQAYARISYLREIYGDDEGSAEAMTMAVKAGLPGTEEAAWTRCTLGNFYLGKGKLQEAEMQYRMARAERTDFPWAIAGMAKINMVRGNNEVALKMLDTALKLIPEFSFAELQAEIYRSTGNTVKSDSMVAVIEKMLSDDEAAGHYADKEFALLYCKMNVKPQQALMRAEKELSRRPNNIEAQYAMAYALLENGLANEAKEYITRALRMKTNNKEFIATAAKIEQRLGNLVEAAKYVARLNKLS